MKTIETFIAELWSLTAQMAPYLLLGFLIAGLVRVFISPLWIQKHLGKAGFAQTLKAALLGVPLPLCSCGVIPVAASIHKQGGSSGAVVSFTASTPQTGIDSILVTASLLSWPFAFIRVVSAFLSGLFAGVLVDRFAPHKPTKTTPTKSCCCNHSADQTSDTNGTSSTQNRSSALKEGLSFGLRELPKDIGKALVLGLVLAAAVSTFLPHQLTGQAWTHGFLAYFIVTIVSIPLYVCSTGSIPMALALITTGFSPGAALVFLIAGPATNTATVTALWAMLGKRATVLYLAAIIFVAWSTGILIDSLHIQLPVQHTGHEMTDINTFQQITAFILILFIAQAFLSFKTKNPTS